MKIPKEALALSGAVATDPTRYQLTGVYFTRNGSPSTSGNGGSQQMEACATDGKQMTRLRWEPRDDETKGDGEFSVILSKADCKQLQKCCNSSTEYLEISEATQAQKMRAVFVGSGTQDVEPLPGHYPKYAGVLKRGPEYDRIALVNPFILRNQLDVICKALGWRKGGDHIIKLHIARPGKDEKTVNEPLMIEASEGPLSVDAAVMPIVLNKGKG